MDFRIIPPKKRAPNKYDDETFIIPAKILQFGNEDFHPKILPVLIERIDFKSGKIIKTKGITFKKSMEYFANKKLPIKTDCIIYKEQNRINYKIIGTYNSGLIEKLYQVEDHILNNDESQIIDIFESNYMELNEWVGDYNSKYFDVI